MVSGPKGNKKYIYQNNNSMSKSLNRMKSGDYSHLGALDKSVFHGNSLLLQYILDKENNGENTKDRLHKIILTAYNNYKVEDQGDQGDKASDLKDPDKLDNVINSYLVGQWIGLAEADKSQQHYLYGMPIYRSNYTIDSNGKIVSQSTNNFAIDTLKGYLFDEIKRMQLAYDQLYSDNPDIRLKPEDQVIYFHYGSKVGAVS